MRTSHLAGLAGALALVASLWLPWYALDLTALGGAVQDGAAAGQLPTGWTEFLQGIVAALPQSITASGWEATEGADVALVALAAVSFVGVWLAGARPAGGQLMAVAGAIAAVIALVHIVDPAGPGGLLQVRAGIWVALLGAAAMIAGGATAALSSDGERDEPWMAGAASFGAADPAPGASTPPPS